MARSRQFLVLLPPLLAVTVVVGVAALVPRQAARGAMEVRVNPSYGKIHVQSVRVVTNGPGPLLSVPRPHYLRRGDEAAVMGWCKLYERADSHCNLSASSSDEGGAANDTLAGLPCSFWSPMRQRTGRPGVLATFGAGSCVARRL